MKIETSKTSKLDEARAAFDKAQTDLESVHNLVLEHDGKVSDLKAAIAEAGKARAESVVSAALSGAGAKPVKDTVAQLRLDLADAELIRAEILKRKGAIAEACRQAEIVFQKANSDALDAEALRLDAEARELETKIEQLRADHARCSGESQRGRTKAAGMQEDDCRVRFLQGTPETLHTSAKTSDVVIDSLALEAVLVEWEKGFSTAVPGTGTREVQVWVFPDNVCIFYDSRDGSIVGTEILKCRPEKPGTYLNDSAGTTVSVWGYRPEEQRAIWAARRKAA